MFQRIASALFGDEAVERIPPGDDGEEEEEEEEDWILVKCVAGSGSSHCDDDPPGPTIHHDDEDEDLVMIPSPGASPQLRYASCTSLNSTADTDPDGGAGEEEDEEEEESGFQRLDATCMEESWFVTPPPCFTRRGCQPVLLETSPLENLLIEHPSMSVYARRSPPPRLALEPLPRSPDRELGFLSGNAAAAPAASGGKEKARRTLDGPRHRPEVPRRSSLHSACYAAALSARAGLLPQRQSGGGAVPPLSRNALRRLNLLRPPKANAVHLHQPGQRHLNF